MLFALAALLAALQPAPPAHARLLGRTAWILGTVQQSEWCPAGNVRLDLRTGRYQLTPGAARSVCHDAGLERPVLNGVLRGERLEVVRAAYLLALTEGLMNPACRDGGRPDVIVVNNAGTPILVLATGSATRSPPDDMACWSTAAQAVHRELEDVFERP
jgi:hypothetical protein